MKKSWHLSRREVLRGLGGISLGLPFLEAMAATAPKQASAPKRLACMFFPNGVTLPKESDPHHAEWHWFPKGEGKGFQAQQVHRIF